MIESNVVAKCNYCGKVETSTVLGVKQFERYLEKEKFWKIVNSYTHLCNECKGGK